MHWFFFPKTCTSHVWLLIQIVQTILTSFNICLLQIDDIFSWLLDLVKCTLYISGSNAPKTSLLPRVLVGLQVHAFERLGGKLYYVYVQWIFTTKSVAKSNPKLPKNSLLMSVSVENCIICMFSVYLQWQLSRNLIPSCPKALPLWHKLLSTPDRRLHLENWF